MTEKKRVFNRQFKAVVLIAATLAAFTTYFHFFQKVLHVPGIIAAFVLLIIITRRAQDMYCSDPIIGNQAANDQPEIK